MSFTTKSVLFGGTNEYVTMGDVLGFEYTDPFSVSFWLKTTTSGYLISKMDSAPRGWGAYITASSGIEFLLINTSATNLIDVFGPTGLNDGRWHHVVWTTDGTTAAGVTCYVDGSAVGTTTSSDTLSATIVSTGPLNLASRTNGTGVYAGDLDEVAVYDKELTSGEVTAIYNGGLPNDLSQLSSASNLVGWWRMGEGDTFPTLRDSGVAGTNLTCPDLSPSGNDGTPTNMESGDVSSDVAGGRACTFNGTNEWVDFGNVYAFERTDPFSVSVWFKTTATGVQTIMGKLDNSPNARGWDLSRSNNGLAFSLYSAFDAGNRLLASAIGFSSASDGQWHHVVVSYDGSSTAMGVSFVVDGVAYVTNPYWDTLTGTIVNAIPFMIGRHYQSVNPAYFDGEIDDTAIYDKALSLAEAQNIYNGGSPDDLSGDANLVGYWRMGDGATSPTIPDDSTNSNNGTMTNMDATNFVDGVPGDFSYASFDFGGTDEFITMGDVLGFEYNQAFSVSCWVKKPTALTGGFLVSKKAASGLFQGWAVGFNSSDTFKFWLDSNGGAVAVEVYTTATYAAGVWHHAVFTYSGNGLASGVTVYVNGVSAALTTLADTLASNTILNTASLNVGASDDGGAGVFPGNVDEVLVYNVELTPTQVSDLFAFGAPVDPTALDSWADAVGYWRMGEASFDGTMTNMESGDIGYSTPAGLDGQGLSLTTPLGSGGAFKGRAGVSLALSFVPAGLNHIYYRMRAWNLNTGDWELWTAEGAPNEDNPSGDPITNVSVLTVWET